MPLGVLAFLKEICYCKAVQKEVLLMSQKLQKLKWNLHCKKERLLLTYGLIKGLITPYDDELIEKLRKVYYGGIPASIVLLSKGLIDGYCYDRALLMSKAFLEDDDDIQLLCATIDRLKLNPECISDNPLYADHCIVERTTKEGKHLIYDTSVGLIYDKNIYWMMQNPKIRHINSKEAIKKFIEEDEDYPPDDINKNKYAAAIILPMIEKICESPNEMYSAKKVGLLQREIKHFKQQIDYDSLVAKTNHVKYNK